MLTPMGVNKVNFVNNFNIFLILELSPAAVAAKALETFPIFVSNSVSKYHVSLSLSILYLNFSR